MKASIKEQAASDLRVSLAKRKIFNAMEGLERDQQRSVLSQVLQMEEDKSGKLQALQKELANANTPEAILKVAERSDAVNGGNLREYTLSQMLLLSSKKRAAEEAIGGTNGTHEILKRAQNNLAYPGRSQAKDVVREGEDLRAQIAELNREHAAKAIEFESIAGISFYEWRERIVRAAKEAAMPPLTSANNVEVGLMGIAHVCSAADFDGMVDAIGETLAGIHATVARQREYSRNLMEMVTAGDTALCADVSLFATWWRESSYAKLEVGHKLAASLCLTDVPEELTPKMPWPAWSLIVPDGLLGELARIWVLDAEDLHAGKRRQVFLLVDRHGRHPGKIGEVENEMIHSLVYGAALALSNPEDFRKERHHKPSARSAKGRTGGAPDLTSARFLLSAAVKVDLREHVRAALDDERAGRRRGSSPKVQFLVRGHWRNQAHGPGLTLRTPKWIFPFWKGPEAARILLRTHRVEDHVTETIVSTIDPKERN